MQLKLIRETFTDDATTGLLLINGKFFGYTIEDTVRAEGVKIAGKTAIPKGKYNVTVDMSIRFKRRMCLLNNVPNFAGIRIHGGNTSADTEGCILIAKNRVGVSTIQGTLEKDITVLVEKAIARGEQVWMEIV